MNKMKQLVRITVLALVVTVGCSKTEDDTTVKGIESLKTVDFTAKPDVVLRTSQTTKAYPNPEKNGVSEPLTITTTRKTNLLNPLTPVIGGELDEIIYPGSILRGSSFIEGKYDPLVLSNKFNKVTLSTTLKNTEGAVTPLKRDVFPTLSSVREGISGLISEKESDINFGYIPADINYTKHEVTTEESFAKSLDIHASLEVKLKIINVSANFSFQKKETNTFESKYVLISFRQKLYSASIDPKFYTDWIDGGIKPSECGDYEPLYISNVDYGRIAYMLFETKLSKEELFTKISSEINVSYAKMIELKGKYTLTTEAIKKFTDEKVQFFIKGGPAGLAVNATTLDGFTRFLTAPTPKELVATSVPIGYVVRRLKDNTGVEVRTTYEEETATFPK
jgi:thiol-activated cytolysin